MCLPDEWKISITSQKPKKWNSLNQSQTLEITSYDEHESSEKGQRNNKNAYVVKKTPVHLCTCFLRDVLQRLGNLTKQSLLVAHENVSKYHFLIRFFSLECHNGKRRN